MHEFDFETVIPIEKGWSEDKKYRVEKKDGRCYLLRVTPIQRYETRKALFAMLERVAQLEIPMCKPVEFGICKDGVYALHTWINGSDAGDVIPILPKKEQYASGVKAGEILRKIHAIPAPDTQEQWSSRFNRKVDEILHRYRECPIHFQGDEALITYIENNRSLLENRPQCFQHGDYHIGNMMVQNGSLTIIDFDRYDFGDPWEEFNRIVWSAQTSPCFAAGQIDGYFDGRPPAEFFRLLSFYIACNTLSSIYWAVPFGQEDIDVMMKQSQNVLSWYRSMDNIIPSWYRKYEESAKGQKKIGKKIEEAGWNHK